MAVGFSNTNKPINPRGNDQSPKGYNRAALYSGKALDFDGVNDKVDCGTLDVTDYTAISVATYIKKSDTTTRIPFSLIHSGSDDIRITTDTNLKVTLDDGTAYDLSTPIESNTWVFAVFTFDGSTFKGYLNGVEFGSMSASFDFSTADGTLVIGERATTGGLDFYGQIGNTKIFNTALTAAQVADLYNNPEKIVPTGVDNTALKLWLPMMEGAGTTAYDGSGGGNHGTISGATWTHGIGSPVAQTAVIDWNKGTNIIVYSQEFESPNWIQASGGTGASVSVTENYGISPSGYQDAYRIQISTGSGGYGQIYQSQGLILGATYTVSVYLKSLNGNVIVDLGWFNGAETNFPANVTEEWQRFTYTFTDTANVCYPKIAAGFTSSNNVDVLAYGYQIEQASSVGPYVRTGATAQTSDVLLPQGLTSGRDITGVNLFENVRKQGALNLDGNSWAEVHDNASLDITDAITLEAWVYWDGVTTNSGILGRWFTGATSYMLYVSTGTQALFFINTSSTAATISGTGWKHIVGTYDSTIRRIYVDGQEIGSGDAYTSPIATNDKPIEVGRYAGDMSGAKSVKEQIAQPRIYNRALTAAEVLQNYNSGKSIYTNS